MCRDVKEEAVQLKDRVQNTTSRLEMLPCQEEGQEGKAFWRGVIEENLLTPARGRRRAVVRGVPSVPLAQQLAEEELRRIAQQVGR